MYPDIRSNDLLLNLFKKKEFNELLDNDKINFKYKILDKYQEFIRRYISPYTYYDRLLLLHSTGTGKSFAAIAVAETHREYKYNCLILVKGKTSELNFKTLITEFYKKNSLNLIKNDKYYNFDRFIKFTTRLSRLTNNEIIKEFSNKIIIIDEVHNIKEVNKKSTEYGVYKSIQHMLRIIKNSKILFLTATPMVDNANELLPLLNLIIKDKIEAKKVNIKIIKDRISGIISYCDTKYNIPNIKINGILLPDLKFKVYISYMKGHQLKAWEKLNKKTNKPDPVYRNRIYCSTIVSPELNYGKIMKDKYIKEVDINNYGKKFVLNGIDLNINNLDEYSCKFSSMINLSINCEGCIYVFCEDIEGSGLKILSAILENIGYSMFTTWDNNMIKKKDTYYVQEMN